MFKIIHAEALTQTSSAMSEHSELSPLEVRRRTAKSLELSRVSEFSLWSPRASGLGLPSPFLISSQEEPACTVAVLRGAVRGIFCLVDFHFR